MKKNVFLTLSSIGVFKNLFFFPGSVFDRLIKKLKESRSVRLVILMPPAYSGKYGSFLMPHVGEFLFIETVDIKPPRAFFERLFYFFYSYLIYTSTTKMLATMGLRPDEPPAGGRRYLSPVKYLIANTFGRSVLFKKRTVPMIYNSVFRERPFRELFIKYEPHMVFASHIYGIFDAQLLQESRRLGVSTMGMASGWDHLDKYFLPFKVRHLLAQSSHIREKAIEYQLYEPQEISVVGYPHLDFVSDQRYALSREGLLNKLGFPASARFLLYISGSAYCPDEPDVIEEILKWITHGRLGENLFLVIRPYVGGRGADIEFDKKKFMRFEEHPKVAFYKKESWSDLPQSIFFMNLIRHADVIISIFTSALLEAAVFGRPLVGVAFDGYRKRPFHRSIRRFTTSEHFKGVLKIGGLRLTHNFFELEKALREYLNNPRLDQDRREVMRRKLLHPLDGRSSDRIVECLLRELEHLPPKAYTASTDCM